MSYILNPAYGDMSVVVLGSSLVKIKKSLREKHWSEHFDWPDTCSEEKTEQVKNFLLKDHKTIDELVKDYNESFDEDYTLEESY